MTKKADAKTPAPAPAKTSIEVAALQLMDDPEFSEIGTGYRHFLVWRGEKLVYLFYVPRLLALKPLTAERFTALKPRMRPSVDAAAFANAIKVNRSRAITGGYWDGGQMAEHYLKLLDGGTMTEKEFWKPEAVSKPLVPIWIPADKNRVHRSSDESDVGTIIKAGPQQSEVKWDSGEKSIETNASIRLHEDKETPVTTTTKKAAKTKAEPKAKANGKKAKAEPKAKANNGKSRSRIPEGKIIIKAKANPRREGTKAHKLYAEMEAYVKKHPGATAADVLAKTNYRINDLQWDLSRKDIEVRK